MYTVASLTLLFGASILLFASAVDGRQVDKYGLANKIREKLPSQFTVIALSKTHVCIMWDDSLYPDFEPEDFAEEVNMNVQGRDNRVILYMGDSND